MERVYLIVSIDTECDKGRDWTINHPFRYTSVTDGIPNVLMPLFEKYSVKPTFLLSPEVIQDDQCVSVLSGLRECELGSHLHGEFINPEADFIALRSHTPQLLYEPRLEFEKLRNLTRLFEERFGYYPKSFRAGRFGISNYTLKFLTDLGYLVDSSVTPFWTHNFEGRAVRNYWGASLLPYYPANADIRRSGKIPVLEVPVTIINSLLMKWPRSLLRMMNNQTRWHKRILGRLGRQVPKTLWLRPHRSTAEEMIGAANAVISLASSNKRPIVLNMMYHSVEFIRGASPYSKTEEEIQNNLRSQDELFSYLTRNFDVKSIGLSEACNLFQDTSEDRD